MPLWRNFATDMPGIDKFLTPRLMMIADLVPTCNAVCDIGTDHGYIAIYLAKKGIAKKVIAADINRGPLNQAEKNIALFNVSEAVETRLSNGFENIGQNEVDCAIIAGMGGETIAEILKNEKGCKHFVLQMQTAHRDLREYLSENGFVIEKEAIAKEGRKMYTALLCTKGSPYTLTETEKEIGPLLVKERPPLFSDYVKYRLYEIESILKKMGDGVSSPKKEHMLYLKNEYENLLKGER